MNNNARRMYNTQELSDFVKQTNREDFVLIGAPAAATNGTLEDEQLEVLLNDTNAYIMFNNEKYYLMDIEHEDGYMTYSHIGIESEAIKIKVITITTTTGGWVLTTKEVA